MAEASAAWAQPGYQPIDSTTFTITLLAVELGDE
jgi:hypothetical protein